MIDYFATIWRNTKAILQGHWITLRYMFKPAVTIHYPDEKLVPFEKYRGALLFNAGTCISCNLCVKACPSNCIQLEERDERNRQEDREGRLVLDRLRQVQLLPSLRGGLPDEAEVGVALAGLRGHLHEARRDGALLEEGLPLRGQVLGHEVQGLLGARGPDPHPRGPAAPELTTCSNTSSSTRCRPSS